MSQLVTRRGVLAATPIALGGLTLSPRTAASPPPSDSLSPAYPAQDTASVREVVSASHFSLEKVQALVDERPELANAAWDWGFGDWETALGAASHTGRVEIAEYLLSQGARPDIFTAAMLGNLQAVRDFIEATPGIQGHFGPHGINLRQHAQAGRERATAVLAYLDEIGGADPRYTDLPLEIGREAILGSYRFGGTAEDVFELLVGSRDNLMMQRGTGTPRSLFHQGNHVFHPAGAPSAKVRFHLEGDVVTRLDIRNPGLILEARRV